MVVGATIVVAGIVVAGIVVVSPAAEVVLDAGSLTGDTVLSDVQAASSSAVPNASERSRLAVERVDIWNSISDFSWRQLAA